MPSMTDSIYQYVLDELENSKGKWPVIARAIGMSLRTLEKIARKEVKDPGVSHVEKLACYFRAQSAKPPGQRLSA